MYNYVEVKKQKGSRVNKEGCKGREEKKTDENATYGPPDKQQHLKLRTPQVTKKKK